MSKNRNKVALWITLALLTGASIGDAVYGLSLQAAKGFTIEEQIGDTSTESSIDDLFDITNNKTHITSYNNDGTKTWYFDDGFWVKFDSEYNVIAHGLTSKEAASIINNPTIGPMGHDIEKDFNGHIKEWPEEPKKIILGDGDVVYDFPEGIEIVFNNDAELVNDEPEFIYVGNDGQSLSSDDAESTIGL